MPKYKIAVGFVTGQRMLHEIVSVSLLQMMSGRDWSDYEFTVLNHSSIYVDVNRNNIIHQFKKTDADFLFYWDYDNGLFPEAFDLYMEDMQNPDVNILSGLYYRKGDAMRTICGIAFQDMDAYTVDSYMFVSGGLLDLTTYAGATKGMVGAGCLMIRREVFDTLPYPWFKTEHFPSYYMGKWGFTTEDTVFCELAQEHGYHIHLDTRIRSAHWDRGDCYPDDWRQYDNTQTEDPPTVEIGVIGPKQRVGGS